MIWQDWLDEREAEGKGKRAKELYKTYVEVMKRRGEPVLVKVPGLYE